MFYHLSASLFGGLFLRSPHSGHENETANRRSQLRDEGRKKAAFIYHFLQNEYDE